MKLKNIILVHLFPNRHVIQFSPIRTGSTLVYNILRECLPDKKITKAHTYCRHFSRLKVVATMRHPFDSIASILQTQNQAPSEEHIRAAVTVYKRNGGSDLIKVKNNTNVMLLKYEEFVNNFEPIFSGVERLFNLNIPAEKRSELTKKYSIEGARKITAIYGNTGKWDPVTQLHGRHISKFEGRPSYHKDFFTDDQRQTLHELLKEELLALNYN